MAGHKIPRRAEGPVGPRLESVEPGLCGRPAGSLVFSSVRVLIQNDPDDVAAAAADMIRDELAVPGPVTLGLAGGSTPAVMYGHLSDAAVDWSRVTLWLGDERWVPADHPDSNERMARQRLGEEATSGLIAPDFGRGQPHAAAAAYERDLAEAFAPTGGVPGTVLLGIGTDGHTASLFPGSNALSIEDRWYVANRVESLDAWRLTATVPLLASARHVIFLVTGAAKAAVVAEILDGAVGHPARVVAERAAAVTWILDPAAASGLDGANRL